MPVDAPTPGFVAKGIDDHLRCLEGAVTIIDSHIHAGIAKADDIRSQLAGMGITLEDLPDGKTIWHM